MMGLLEDIIIWWTKKYNIKIDWKVKLAHFVFSVVWLLIIITKVKPTWL